MSGRRFMRSRRGRGRGPEAGDRRPGSEREAAGDDGMLDLYVDGLRRSQLQLSLAALVALFGLVAALPLLALVVPALDGASIGQVPIIALLPLVPFPAFVLVGILHSRRAGGLDRAFGSLDPTLGGEDDDPPRPGAGRPPGEP